MLPSIYILLHGAEIVVDLETYGDPCGILSLQLNPDNYQHATLKSFNVSIEKLQCHYIAQYPVPP